MANRNRSAGIRFEQEIVVRLKSMGYNVATSRYVSRLKDDMGIDIVGDFPLEPQLKATVKTPSIHDLLTTTAADVIFWRRMVKKGERFYKDGEYAMLPLDTLLEIINLAYKKEKL